MSTCNKCGVTISGWGLCPTCRLNEDQDRRHVELFAFELRKEINESIRHKELVELENQRIATSIRLANEADLKNEDAYKKGLDYDLSLAAILLADGSISLDSELKNQSGYILDRLKQSFVEGVKENFIAEFSGQQLPLKFLTDQARVNGYEAIDSYYSQIFTYKNCDMNTPSIFIIEAPSKTGKYKALLSGSITPDQIENSEFIDGVTGELRFNSNKFSVFNDGNLDKEFFKGVTDYYTNNLNSPDKKQARLNQLALEQKEKDARDKLARDVLLAIGFVVSIFLGVLIFL